MKRRILCLIFCWPWLLHAAPFSVENPVQRLLAPDFQLTDVQGNPVRLSDYHGKLVVLHFWATWCGPCRQEMPALQQLQQQYQAQGLEILAVSQDSGSNQPVQNFIRRYQLKMPVLSDGDGKVAALYDVAGLPTSYVIGRDGRMVVRIIGDRDWQSEKARQWLAEELAPGDGWQEATALPKSE